MIRGATRRRKTNTERALIRKVLHACTHTHAQWSKPLPPAVVCFHGVAVPIVHWWEEEWRPNNASSGRKISQQKRYRVTTPPCAAFKSLCCCRCTQQIFSLLGSALRRHDGKITEKERKENHSCHDQNDLR